MKLHKFQLITILSGLIFLLNTHYLQAQESDSTKITSILHHSLDTSPVSPLFNIYAIQYGYRFSPNSELLMGVAYANVKYDAGRSHAPTLIFGYRQYIWQNLHIEYQLWSSYNSFYEFKEKKYYNGFELWNEARIGYTIDFSISQIPFYVNLQCLFGFGLYGGNKPQSFKDEIEDEALFIAPVFFVGMRF